MRSKKFYYLGERHNPQLSKPYYIKFGQLTKKDAKDKGNTLYGSIDVISFDTEKKYNDFIQKKKEEGYTVN